MKVLMQTGQLAEILNTAIFSLSQDLKTLEALNPAAKKLIGFDISTIADKIKSKQKRIECKISGQAYNIQLSNIQDSYILEINPIVYQDMNQSTHELRRPIQNIKSLTEALIIGAKNDPQKLDEYLSKLNHEADRLAVMVNDMLSLSHLINGIEKPNLVSFNLHDRIDKLLELAKTRINNGVQLNNKITNDIEITADIKLFDHLVSNLIDNAIKYNKDKGKVIVSFDTNQLIISDTGLGMSQEDASKVFDQFYRIADRAHIQGTGLGLSIVKAIVDLHAWKISIDSKLGQGTKFVIELL